MSKIALSDLIGMYSDKYLNIATPIIRDLFDNGYKAM